MREGSWRTAWGARHSVHVHAQHIMLSGSSQLQEDQHQLAESAGVPSMARVRGTERLFLSNSAAGWLQLAILSGVPVRRV